MSAKTSNNIFLAFDELKKLIMLKIKKNNQIAPSFEKIQETINNKKDKCC